jgi:DHA1 family tetracycline resistance protein-like MFS transporter
VIIGPFVFSFIFYHFTNRQTGYYFPGAPYLLAALLMLISVFLAIKSFSTKVKKVHVRKSVKPANPA